MQSKKDWLNADLLSFCTIIVETPYNYAETAEFTQTNNINFRKITSKRWEGCNELWEEILKFKI